MVVAIVSAMRGLRDSARARATALEFALLAAIAALSLRVLDGATARWLERVAELSARAPAEERVLAAARDAGWFFAAGVVVLAIGRAMSLRRARDPLPAPLLLPSLAGASLLGLALHAGTVDMTAGRILVPTAAPFASGFLIACVVGAAILALPLDPARLASRLQGVLVGGIAAVFFLLALFGSGPGLSDARVNLGPIQPIEAVKAALVLFAAVYLGERAAKLRWQRVRFAGLRWPRPVLLVPAAVVLTLSFLALYLVRDLGPTMILAPVFIGLVYLGTRASGLVLGAALALAGGIVALALAPSLAGEGLVGTRIVMWLDPWQNGLTHGHQLGEGLWAVAAGGAFGQGIAQGHVPPPPEAKTDLILVLLMEQIGFVGLLAYLAILAILVLSILVVAARNRTPERMIMAAGVALLLVVQWAIIHAGSLGALPLTGVVAPFLSHGRSSMVVFVALVALVARLAEDGRARAVSAELDELRPALRALAIALFAAIAAGAGLGLHRATAAAPETSARGILVELADGTLRHRQNPRLEAMRAEIVRGSILDRRGAPLAEGGRPGALDERRYPLGSALGTLLGRPPGGVCLPWWALEARFDEHLRGYPERDDPPGTRLGCHGRAPIPSPDLRALVPLLRQSRPAREESLAALAADTASRSIALSLDARLQRAAHDLLREATESSSGLAGAAAVIDVDTGEVLARVQFPDIDPGDPSWRARLSAGDRALTGAYGAIADKTGLRGLYQSGSVGKLATSLAAARQGWSFQGPGCRVRAEPTFACEEMTDDRPSFGLPDWSRPIRDFPGDSTHGVLDVVGALAVSCNVYFGQLALALGPDSFVDLVAGGVDVGPYDSGGRNSIQPGAPDSRRLAETGYGQGGTWMNVMQAARLTAAIGAGGVYRRCPPTLEQGAPCEELRLLDDPDDARPILAGMRAVMESGGTGARLRPPRGVRVYGKTGTAEAPGFSGEDPYGIAPGAKAPPHSWFVALAEPERAPECGALARGRIAVAVVIPRGGSGARVAGSAAMRIIAELATLGYFGPDAAP